MWTGQPYPVTRGGVQTLTVSTSSPLLLFDLNVAWSGTPATTTTTRRSSAPTCAAPPSSCTTGRTARSPWAMCASTARRAAQSAAGRHQAWNNAHIRIYATNRLRPNADQGGVISRDITETVQITDSVKEIAYLPGQVRMGATWNRRRRTTGNLGDDWPAALAHELGHYLLFLDDNYLTARTICWCR